MTFKPDPSRRIVKRGAPIGVYRNRLVWAWYETANGHRAYYSGIYPVNERGEATMDLEDALTNSQEVVWPGLIYDYSTTVPAPSWVWELERLTIWIHLRAIWRLLRGASL